MNSIPSDYAERVYAGVLGKIIGVYLGRPFEGWTYDHIMRELGEVTYYVNDRIAHHPPLIVTDDDITGTFTFLRALPDYGNTHQLSAAQIGQTWLNYLIERQTILWWGGTGNSTEHTAYVRLKHGIVAPRSGSIELNSKVVAEQIGAQIFIDGWAMVSPGNPSQAAELAGKAGSVSHDGEAVYGAQALAAMEAQAFVESDINKLLDIGASFVPHDCLIARLIADIRNWRKLDNDWHATRARIEAKYGYDAYGGGCHMIPNHAIIILALVYCEEHAADPGLEFQRALTIGNTAGWDTDCNSGNIGCLMGIRNGLRGIDSGPVDWRGPWFDRLYLPTADGGRCITDAAQEARRIARIGRVLAADTAMHQVPDAPSPRFDFELPGSLQGFSAAGDARIENVAGHSATGARSLAVHLPRGGAPGSASTATFIPPDALTMPGYGLIASPTLYPGQTISAGVMSDVNVHVNLFVCVYSAGDALTTILGPCVEIAAGDTQTLTWSVEGIDGGSPIAEIGLHATSLGDVEGTVYLDYLTWSGAPNVTLTRPEHNGTLWQRSWVKACDDVTFGRQGFRICQDEGPGLLIQGEREWADYNAQARIIPHLACSAGIAVCVQGVKRYYALVLCSGHKLRLIKALSLNPGAGDNWRTLTEVDCDWQLDRAYTLGLATQGDRLIGKLNGQALLNVQDTDHPLLSGAVALLIDEGRLDCDAVSVSALSPK